MAALSVSADIKGSTGRLDQALPIAERLLCARRATLRPGHESIADALALVAELERELGRYRRAIEHLREALTLVEAGDPPPIVVANIKLSLGRALRFAIARGREKA